MSALPHLRDVLPSRTFSCHPEAEAEFRAAIDYYFCYVADERSAPIVALIVAPRDVIRWLVVVGVAADPEPQQAIRDVDSECSIVHPDTHRSVSAGLLEVERRVRRILFQKSKLRIGELSNVLRQPLVAIPESR